MTEKQPSTQTAWDKTQTNQNACAFEKSEIQEKKTREPNQNDDNDEKKINQSYFIRMEKKSKFRRLHSVLLDLEKFYAFSSIFLNIFRYLS